MTVLIQKMLRECIGTIHCANASKGRWWVVDIQYALLHFVYREDGEVSKIGSIQRILLYLHRIRT